MPEWLVDEDSAGGGVIHLLSNIRYEEYVPAIVASVEADESHQGWVGSEENVRQQS